MVAYNFKLRFVEAVATGAKRQTIRAHRRRHARPGEPVQLFYAMRTPLCRKLVDPDPVCLSAESIEILVPQANRPAYWLKDRSPVERAAVDDDFARADGFEDAADFALFWRRTHGEGLFRGVLIRWAPA